MKKYMETAVETALKAGKYLKRRFASPKNISYKGENDIVTDCDIGSEQLIIKILKKAFPDHHVVAEETGMSYRRFNKGFCWIIDPLDGTTNFAHGYPVFCVSVALEYNGKIILGAVYNPMLNELFTADLGKGAYLNGGKIHVSKIKNLSQSLLVTGFPYEIRRTAKTNLEYFSRFQLRAEGVRRDGSAALNLCYTACGRFDGFWELHLKPWDTAAGSLILKEAGGSITDFKGKKFSIYKAETLATNGLIHRQMLKIILVD